jgi:hypothetical protein
VVGRMLMIKKGMPNVNKKRVEDCEDTRSIILKLIMERKNGEICIVKEQ